MDRCCDGSPAVFPAVVGAPGVVVIVVGAVLVLGVLGAQWRRRRSGPARRATTAAAPPGRRVRRGNTTGPDGAPDDGGRHRTGRGAAGRWSVGARPASPPVRPSLVGTTAVAITGPDPSGQPVDRRWEARQPELVAFLTGGCSTCQAFWTGFADPAGAGAAPGGLPVVVVTPSPGTESRRGVAGRATGGLKVIMSSEAWMAYGVRAAPWFVVVAGGHVQAEGHAGSWAELRALVER